MSPVWFHAVVGRVEIVIAEGDAKLERLRADPRCVFMAFETAPPFRGLKVSAEATLTSDDVREVRVNIASRYLGEKGGRRYVEQRTKPGVVVRLPLARSASRRGPRLSYSVLHEPDRHARAKASSARVPARVEAGEGFEGTLFGRPVAQLPSLNVGLSTLAHLIAEGRVTPPLDPDTKHLPAAVPPTAGQTATAALLAERKLGFAVESPGL